MSLGISRLSMTSSVNADIASRAEPAFLALLQAHGALLMRACQVGWWIPVCKV
jgi:hypothetical protein